jgi:hypothetical protein
VPGLNPSHIINKGGTKMDRRKDYAPPAIEWEDVLEQTSLACNTTQSVPAARPACFAGEGSTAFKGGAFDVENISCRVYPEVVVVLS